MRFTLFLITLFISSNFLMAQTLNRIEVTGKIVVDSDDKFGITIYNKSSKQGSITDEKGALHLL